MRGGSKNFLGKLTIYRVCNLTEAHESALKVLYKGVYKYIILWESIGSVILYAVTVSNHLDCRT